MGFRSVAEIVEAVRGGKVHTAHVRKVPSQASTAGHWVDLSMAAGNPPPNYYAAVPLEAVTLDGFRGIFHGDDVGGAKRLINLALMSTSGNAAGAYWLLDYLLFYPFADLDDTSPQAMTNDVELPRYADGDGVRAMLVCLAPTVGGGSFTYDYVNQDGAARTSPVIACNTTAANIATIVTSQQAVSGAGSLFLPMQSGDTGIRRITGITMIAPAGGLAAIVLVRPLAEMTVREINVPEERSLVHERTALPEILDGAYLGLAVNCAGTVAGIGIVGRFTFAWD